uniref:Ubiquinone biosynthesis monooxygenase COQ6, mitochondrial n=1 Tax=Melianthus villosus TaxID=377280 RepID=A0A0G2T3P7_9ROSI|nr:FAD/NAD(P)-binding oxidoreductase family protein [Melianthus villosus]
MGNLTVFKVSRKRLCTDAAAKASISTSGKPVHEHEENQSFRSDVQQYDIAIVGGGMVGMALASSLASTPLTKHLSVAIIDSNPALGSKKIIKKEDPPDPRVSTVTPVTISLFKDVGAWQYVEQNRHAYFESMQVWDYTGLGYTRYDARDISKEVLGCVVENKVLHSALFSSIQDTDFQKTIYPCRLSSMTVQPNISYDGGNDTLSKTKLHNEGRLAKLELSDGNSLYAKLVVGADGGKSHVRELAGLKTTGWKYPQSAVICTVEHDEENHCAWQRFLPAGPIALLPIGDKYSNIVWTMNPKESQECTIMSEDEFVKAVNHALDYGYGPRPKSGLFGNEGILSLLGGGPTLSANEGFQVPPKVVKLASGRMAFPLSLMHANNYASKRVVLIGDAAHTVHPLAGQGVNLGFGDAFALSKIISEGIAVGTDIGELSLLKKYESDRKSANIMMMAVLDGIQKAYSVDFGPLNLLRAAAFHGAHYISPLKKNIISFASGEHKLPLFS